MTQDHNRRIARILLLLLLLLIAITPALTRHHWSLTAFAIARFFSLVCHQDPSRSFTIFGAALPVCVRCFGIYCGAAVGAWLEVLESHARRLLLFALLANLLDIAGEMLGFFVNIPIIRMALGLSLGVGAVALIVSGYPPRPLARGGALSE